MPSVTGSASPPPCDIYNLSGMNDGSTCSAKWSKVRSILHPSQEAVGYAAVKRKVDKDYTSQTKAQKRMNKPGSWLPFVLGPHGIPYLVDSHHTASALEASGYHNTRVTLKKMCDWSHMSTENFVKTMKRHNFMMGMGRRPSSSSSSSNDDDDDDCYHQQQPLHHDDDLPVPIVDITKSIPSTIPQLKDDPWRSFAALVRKVKDEDDACPDDHPKCLRGYVRDCRPDNTMTPFFEFRWAYFFNDAYNQGCVSGNSFWENPSDCHAFQTAYQQLSKQQRHPTTILDYNRKEWQEAAKLLIPLCRGRPAQTYVLPSTLGGPMGGEPLPGRVAGRKTPILREDPKCAAPKCPKLPVAITTKFE